MFNLSIAFVLMIKTLNIVHLIRCDGEVFVLACGEEGILIIQSVGLRVVLIGLL